MKKTIFSLVFLAVFVPVAVRASGIPVLDAANLSQNVMTALYQVMHYTQKLQEIKTQLSQYEDQLRNSLAPAAYIWTQARKAMNELTEIQNQIAYYKRLSNFDSLKSYLKTFATVDAYRGAAWFNEMSEENKKKMLKSEDIPDMIAIMQTMPGMMAVNAAIFVGHKLAGFRGGIPCITRAELC